MAMASGLRIGDAEREAAAAALREHFAQGRLTLEEFQHRLGAGFAAQTARDPTALTGALPHAAEPPPLSVAQSPPSARTRRGARSRPGLDALAGVFSVLLGPIL